jgi:hypothetical protein
MKKSGFWLWERLLAILLLFPVSVFVFFWISCFFLAQWDEAWRPAWLGDGAGAEAIVILPADLPAGFSADLIPFSQANDFAHAHPDSTFLIPLDRQKEVEEQLKSRLKLASLLIEAAQLPNGSERISIEDMDRADDSHGTRYDASKSSVRLTAYRFVGDRDAIGVMLGAMALSALLNVIALLCAVAWLIYRWRKQSSPRVAHPSE